MQNDPSCSPPPDAKRILSGKLENLPYGDFAKDMPFAVVRCNPQRAREPHIHDFHEIVIVTHGSGMHISKYHAWPIQAGDVFVIGGTQGHYYDNVCDLSLVNILFLRHLLRLDTYDIGRLSGFQAMFGMPRLRTRQEFRSRFRLKMKDLSVLLAHVDMMEKEIRDPEPGHEYFAHNHFETIVGVLSRLYSQQGKFDTSAVLRMARVISHMENHFTQSIDMEELAKIAGMTERSFLRAFRQATGNSPHSHLLDLRINRAADALGNTDRQITEIAFNVGFNDSNYFTRQFKKRTGLTPADYRKKVIIG